jgi:pSer/pThr/pTyr-binding forkhead associated (FHA) protein
MADGLTALEEAVTVQLLDAARGSTLQLWCFADKPVISIGRAEERDIVLLDPYVSRHHAELRYQGGQWWLVGLGRHGVWIQGQQVEDALAYDGMLFQLGANGPKLRFCDSMVNSSNDATLSHSVGTIMLRVDSTRLQNEVQEIAEGEYFQRLQQHARQLRRQRVETKT